MTQSGQGLPSCAFAKRDNGVGRERGPDPPIETAAMCRRRDGAQHAERQRRRRGLIRGMIFSGELAPGDWLPAGRELAERLGISVLTLRVALKSLESSGYIVTSRGARGGSRVSDIETLPHLDRLDAREGRRGRRSVGVPRDRREQHRLLAAERRSDAELADIEAAWAAAAADSHTAVLRWNVVFHDALARAAHSSRLAAAMARRAASSSCPSDCCCASTGRKSCATRTPRSMRRSATTIRIAPRRPCAATWTPRARW